MSTHAQQIQKLLLFRLSGARLFALGTLKIREILPFMSLNKLPHRHPSVVGTLMFRGSVVPVIDMAAAVGQRPLSPEEREHGSVIIADVQRQEVGFLVRGVQKIIEANWKQVMPPPGALGEQAFVTGLLDLDGEIIQLIDVELLLARIYPESLAPQAIELTYPQKEALRALNILLVDDSLVARKQLCDALDQLDIRYQVATNGSDAIQMLMRDHELRHPVDILVSDIEMPELDGYELTFDVRDNQSLKQPYIILHTSLNSQMSLEYANQVGANEALTKFNADELLTAILRGADEST